MWARKLYLSSKARRQSVLKSCVLLDQLFIMRAFGEPSLIV